MQGMRQVSLLDDDVVTPAELHRYSINLAGMSRSHVESIVRKQRR